MLSRWFKRSNRLTHAQAEIRLQALAELTDESAQEAQEVLLELATSDPDSAVKTAALGHIADPAALAPLLNDSTMMNVVAARIAALLQLGQDSAHRVNPAVMQARIKLAAPGDLKSLWPDLSTAEQCAVLALKLRDSERDQILAHPLLTNEAGLTVLLRTAKGKDKNCHRLAREKLDSLKTNRSEATGLSERVAELDLAINKALQQAEPKSHSELVNHRQKLIKLAQMRKSVVQELTEKCAALTANGDDPSPFSPPENPLANTELSIPAPQDNPFNALQLELEALSDAMRRGVALAEVTTTQNNLANTWLQHADQFPPTVAQHELFERVFKQFQVYKQAHQRLADVDKNRHTPNALPEKIHPGPELSKWLEKRTKWLKRWQKPIQALTWPADHQPPALQTTSAAELERISAETKQLQAWLHNATQTLTQKLADATNALEEGKFDSARGFLRQARDLQKSGIREHDAELSLLSAQLAEYRDWQQFATDPKRQELISAVKLLGDQPIEPPAQANQLKQLREQWRALGRPSSAEEIELQQQFDQLADLAFAPCREYFNEQAEQRGKNLAARVKLCESLADYLANTDWAHADMQAAETILRSAREEWHLYNPCERKALKPVQTQFEQLQDALHAKVKNAWGDNVAAKQALVDRAKALLEADLEEQTEGAKALQAQWREVGRTPRGPDQRLWREFRQICDEIFAQRDAAKSADKDALNARYSAFEQAVADLEQVTSAATQHSRKDLDELLSGVDELGADLRISPTLKKRIQHVREGYERALKVQARTQKFTDLTQWQNWDDAVGKAEQSGADFEIPHTVFKARATQLAAPIDWHQLTLEAEIAADLSSPPEDQSDRMALQIELMNSGRRNLAAEDYKEMRNRWCEAGPQDATADKYRARFFAALAARL